MDTLSKEEVLEYFKEIFTNWEHLEDIDPVMLREHWNDYTDALNKNGEISDEDYEDWDNPFH